jgi:hypothetical protein
MTADCLPERKAETMDQVRALCATVTLAAAKGMPKSPGSALGLDHLRGMVATVEDGSFSADKLGRWLGWAQCAVVAAGVGITIDDIKVLNTQCVSEADTPGGDPAWHPMLRDSQAAYWKRQYKAAEKAKLLACWYADQAEARLRKAQEAAMSSLSDARDALSWVRKLHRPSGASVCQECGRDWPCATIRAVGELL